MNPIERYGLVALVFFIATVCAVLIWDHEPQDVDADRTAQLERQRDSARQTPTSPVPRTPASRPTGAQSAGSAPPLNPGSRKAQPGSRVNGGAAPQNQAVPAGQQRPGAPVADDEAQLAQAQARARAEAEAERQRQQELRRRQAEQALLAAQQPEREQPSLFSPVAGLDAARTHVVRPGETLSEISMIELGTWKRWREIMDLNGLSDPGAIQIDQELKLPARGQPAPATPAPAASPAVADADYTVQPGDSLSVIAQRELGSAQRWEEIAALNSGVDPLRLSVGQGLRLPDVRAVRPDTTTRVASAPASTPERRGVVR